MSLVGRESDFPRTSCEFPGLPRMPMNRSSAASGQNFAHFGLRLEPPYPGVPKPSGLTSPKSLKKGLLARRVQKASRKSQTTRKRVKMVSKSVFGDFFDTPGEGPWEDLSETFWGFRGSEVWAPEIPPNLPRSFHDLPRCNGPTPKANPSLWES